MSNPIDMQAAIIADLQQRLSGVELYGSEISEGDVLSILDSEDAEQPPQQIVLQDGQTITLETVPGSVREEFTVNVTLMDCGRHSANRLRSGRLAVKKALNPLVRGKKLPGITEAAWLPEVVTRAGQGRSWACRVMPMKFTYIQQL